MNAIAVTRPSRWTPWWDRLSLYLPVVLMGLLALGSYWLVRLTPPPPTEAAPRATSNEPDYFMRDFALRRFSSDGQLQHELRGHEVRHFPDTGHMEVDKAWFRSAGADGRLTQGQGDRVSTNADQTRHHLQGNVVLVREAAADGSAPRLEFLGSSLEVDTHAGRVTSDQPVVLLRGRDRLTANSLDYDDKRSLAVMEGRVRATLAGR